MNAFKADILKKMGGNYEGRLNLLTILGITSGSIVLDMTLATPEG